MNAFLQSSPRRTPAQLPSQPSDHPVGMRVSVGGRCYLVTPDTLDDVLEQIRQDRAA